MYALGGYVVTYMLDAALAPSIWSLPSGGARYSRSRTIRTAKTNRRKASHKAKQRRRRARAA